MGFPFLYLALFLLQRETEGWTVGDAVGQWCVRSRRRD